MKISIILEALTGSFTTDMKRASKEAQRAAKDTEEAWKKAGVVIGAGIASAVTAIAGLTAASINNADKLDEMAQKVGVSAATLSGLELVARRGGTSLDVLGAGLVKLAKNASDTAQGVGTARDGFAALGISVKDGAGNLKATDVLLKEIAGKFAGYKDGAEKTALAVKLFGKSGAELIPTLNLGAEGIDHLQARAQALGITISDEFAANAGAFKDSVEELSLLAKGFGNQLAEALLPSLLQLSTELVEAGVQARETSTAAETLADGFKVVVAAALTAKAVVETLVNVFGAVYKSASAVAEGVTQSFQNSIQGLREYQAAILDLDFEGAFDALGDSLERQKEIAKQVGVTIVSSFDGAGSSVEYITEQLASGYAALFAPIDAVNDGIKETGDDAKTTAPQVRSLAKAAAELAAAEKERAKALKEAHKAQDAAAKGVLALVDEVKDLNAEWAEQARHFDEQAQDLQNEITLLGLSGKAREDMAIALEAERLARDKNGEVIEEERERLEKLLKEYKKASDLDSLVMEFKVEGFDELLKKIEELRSGLEVVSGQQLSELRESIANARQEAVLFATDALGQGISSLQNLATEGSKAFKALEVAQAAANLASAIGAVLNQGNGDPYTAFARMAAMAAAVGALVGSIGSFGGGGGPSSQSAEVTQANQGTGSVLGDAQAKSESIANAIEITADATSKLVGINQGMLRALQSLNAGLSSASGMLARGAGTVEVGALSSGGGILSGLPDPLGLSNMIFGGKQELIDQGIVIMGGALNDLLTNITVGAFSTIETDGGWFHSDDTDTDITDITDEFGAQFQLIIESIADTVREGALALGILPSEIEAAMAAFRVEEIKISLKDLSAEEQQAELAAVFSTIFDGLAGSVVPFIEQFQQLGEGLGETLVRVATGVQVTQEAMLQLGFALDETDPEAFAQISEGLIGLVGGVEDFIAGMSSFVDAFASDDHKFAVAQDALTRAFGQFGLVIPDTRDGMWELMQSLDATTEAGREQIAMLLRTAGVSDAYYSMLEQRAEDAADAAREAAEVALEAEKDRMDAMREYASIVSSIGDQLYELSGASEFQQSLVAIGRAFDDNVAGLNAAARAAGLAGAREEDLASALQLSTLQRARAIDQLRRDIVQQGAAYTPLGIIDAQIAALQDQESAAAQAMRNLGESIEQTGRIASDVASAMLGDFGPLSGDAKADYALKALRDGAISLDAALNAGREVFASGQDFNDFFNEAIGIAGNRRDEVDTGTGGVSAAMQALLKQQTELQQAAADAARMANAQEVGRQIADLAGATGDSFTDTIASLGFDLETFMRDLGVSDEDGLNALLSSFQDAQQAAFQFANEATYGDQQVITWLQAIYDAQVNGSEIITPDVVPLPDTSINGGKSLSDSQEESRKETVEMNAKLERLTSIVERLLPTMADANVKTADGVGTIARTRVDQELDTLADTPRGGGFVRRRPAEA